METAITKHEIKVSPMTYLEYREKFNIPRRAYEDGNRVGFHLVAIDRFTGEELVNRFVEEEVFFAEYALESSIAQFKEEEAKALAEEQKKKDEARQSMEAKLQAMRQEATEAAEEPVEKPKRKRRTKAQIEEEKALEAAPEQQQDSQE